MHPEFNLQFLTSVPVLIDVLSELKFHATPFKLPHIFVIQQRIPYKLTWRCVVYRHARSALCARPHALHNLSQRAIAVDRRRLFVCSSHVRGLKDCHRHCCLGLVWVKDRVPKRHKESHVIDWFKD